MLQNIFNFYLFENPLTLEFRMWIFQVIYIFPTFRFYILQKRSEIIDYTFSFYLYCCLAGVKYLKCYLISLALSFFRKHSSNSASSTIFTHYWQNIIELQFKSHLFNFFVVKAKHFIHAYRLNKVLGTNGCHWINARYASTVSLI